MNDTPEQLLNDQLATCLAAMQDCLTHARGAREDDRHGHLRRHNIHVSRDGAATPVRRDAGRRG